MTDPLATPRAPTSVRAGSAQVALGVGAFALSTYVFTALGTRAMGPAGFSDFSIFWGLVYGLGLGATLPLEQETSRRVSQLWARGDQVGAVLRACLEAASVVVGAAVLLVLPLSLLLSEDVGRGLALWVTTSAALVSLGAAYATRGGLSGTRHFGSYAIQAGTEGAVRVLAAVVLSVAAVSAPWAWQAAVAVALLVAVLASVAPLRRPLLARDAGPRPPRGPILAALGSLVVASAVSQSVVNFGPIVVRVLTERDDRAVAGSFLAAAVIARAPTFAFAAVQAVLLPRLVQALVQGDVRGFRTLLRRALGLTAVLGVLGVLVCLAAGPELMGLLSGPGFGLDRTDIAILAASTGLYLLTLVLQPAALTLEQHGRTALVWLVSGAVFVALCLLPLPPVRAVNLAMVGSMLTACVGLGGLIVHALRRGDAGSGPAGGPDQGMRQTGVWIHRQRR